MARQSKGTEWQVLVGALILVGVVLLVLFYATNLLHWTKVRPAPGKPRSVILAPLARGQRKAPPERQAGHAAGCRLSPVGHQ
jgi:hypothetical protein